MKRALLALLSVAVAAVVVVALLGGFEGDSDTGKTKESADRLPDVTLQPLRPEGKPIDLGTLKGPAVVNLWANWCAPCRKEMPIIERFHRSDTGVSVIGVDSLDTQPGLARKVADQAGVTYPLVVDDRRAVASAARGLPQTLLIDAKGRVVFTAPGGFESLSELQDLVKQHLPSSAGAGR